MQRYLVMSLLLVGIANAHASEENIRWQRHADQVSITRDIWGIAHVYGKTDADTVFGTIYAQAEDDFSRIERNYLTSLGWLARAEGEAAIVNDLRQRLFVDPVQLQRQYRQSPGWLKMLMDAWADGLNYFLSKHSNIRVKVIHHFEPWMALSFTEGSIGGDIETVDLAKLEAFYGSGPPSSALTPSVSAEPSAGGSNGFAIGPSHSASGHALLWINPHTSYYFRSELEMVSDEGLNTYGAATWGQFFIYQGFNAHNGWMHTSYGGDAIDEYAETIVKKPDGIYYRYGNGLRKLAVSRIDIAFRQGNHEAHKIFMGFHSHHGPIVRVDGDQWIAIKLLQDPVPALEQSYLRTKTVDCAGFRKTQDMRTDTSNNTVYADCDGTIAYFHGNFIPRRNTKFDYQQPVDGSNPETEWRGPHPVSDTITLLNPVSGWIQNTNNWPFSAAGPASPKREDYPRYMWTKGENPRGIHAVEVLQNLHGVTLDSLIAAGYDGHLTAFDVLLPPLLEDYDRLESTDPRRVTLTQPMELLRHWDRRTSAKSVATSVAVYWGQELIDRKSAQARVAASPIYDYLTSNLSATDRLDALSSAIDRLQHAFGQWNTPWGDINRYQRLTDDLVQPFDDAEPSLPFGSASATWGALASVDFRSPRTTAKNYGSVGNSFVAAVEFGPTVRAKAIMSGGASGDPASAHFRDQAERFTQGRFRDIFFTRADVAANAERTYRP